MAATPLAVVTEKFGDKAKLVAEVEKFTKDDDLWVSRTNANKGLKHVSNAKLVKLHRTFSEVKEKFGTRAKLIDAILEVEKRVKDEGYKTRLAKFPVPRLYDLYKSAAKRAGAGAKAKDGAEKKKAAKQAGGEVKKAVATKKAAAPKKAAAAKKTAAKK
jgi:hypothetical protein